MSNADATKRYKRTAKGVLTTIYAGSVQKSKRRGMDTPNYTSIDFCNKYINNPIFLQLYKIWVNSNYETKLKPSIDRLDNKISYTFNNIQLVDWQTNLLNANKLTNPLLMHKSVECLNINTLEIIEIFDSIKQASEVTGANKSHISGVCKGKRNQTGGFKWKYYEE